jgi:hypothetical protein
MFRHQQGLFPFPELQFSRGELRFKYLFNSVPKRINIDVDKLNTYVIKKGINKRKYIKITVLSIEVYQRGLT